ncbi:sporulation domain-containing protein [Ketogulonicigenium robustum]|uniref:Sporulation domain-containing protein n=1 Tax=Ketogulonicigenium robustum TaxID=92947 RepID=A0A1W6P0T9_9RHOB|nr:SPOR domain-containing protein [Ketogulonicigenium robustum]ARO15118.1 sporulation domain-containing protein [Ketogulonicigenium robustum]
MCCAIVPLAAAAQPVERARTDDAGCRLLRADVGGQVVWAPVLTPDGAPWCPDARPAPTTAARPAVAPRAALRRAGPQDRYVQVGTFARAANADRAAARLAAEGWPVAVSDLVVNGTPMRGVAAGPFASQAALQAALERARRIGFTDAIPQ